MLKPLLFLLTGLLFCLPSLAQDGSDPAVTYRALTPMPLVGVGAPFSLTFAIGNIGTAPISGSGDDNAHRMRFPICLGKARPKPASQAALSGPLLAHFDVDYNSSTNCFEGRQKQNVQIPSFGIYRLSITAAVTQPSPNTAVNDIGATCTITPHTSSLPQVVDNDYTDIYTHTIMFQCPSRLFVNSSATGANTGLSWADAFTDLQAALTYGCAMESWVASGLYKPTATTNRASSFSVASGGTLYGGFAGTETNLAQRQLSDPLSTTLSGDIGTPGNSEDNSYHVVYFKNASASTRLDGFLISGGTASGPSPNDAGGGIYNNGGGPGNSNTPTLVNLQLVGNRAIYGGALYNTGDTGGNSSPSLINVSLSSNAAGYGGAMYNNGNTGKSSPQLTNVSISSNTAALGGGALYSDGTNGVSTMTLVNRVVSGNGGSGSIVNTNASVQVSSSLLEASISSYSSGLGTLTTTISPFASTTSTQLARNSSAIDAGSNSAYAAVNGPATDLAGNPRFDNTVIDMGAYEFQYPDLTSLLYARPTPLYGNSALTVVVNVLELKGTVTSGLITLKISQDAILSLSLPPSATLIDNRLVNNSV